MAHDPSTCPRCRWAAERLEYTWDEEIYGYTKVSDLGVRRTWFSFCTHLDAVAGLMKEMGEKDLGCLAYYNGSWCWFWPEEWPGPEPEPDWWWREEGRPEPVETEDYSCVIKAAMQVFKEEGSG